MTKALVAHLPHLAFVVIGVAAYAWAALRSPRGARPRAGKPRHAPAPREIAPVRVRRLVAWRGLLALAPLSTAALTGAILYGVNLAREHPAAGVVWAHVVVSVIAAALVMYKLAGVGGRRIIRSLTAQRMRDILSLVLGVLLVPLLGTGIALLLSPSNASFAAYSHLVVSAWWTGLLSSHLWRYLRPALLVLRRRARAA